jgi:sigma-B regulation protein RsbU (phosphoserine phosphatase)
VKIDWRFLPSHELGGDCLGYQWLENGRLAFYILDVCGHGVGAAMLSVGLLNILRSHSLHGIDFSDPAAVLTALNQQFQMSEHGSKFFTMWYGTLDPRTGDLVYSSGGHPPGIVVGAERESRRLGSDGIAIGCVSWAHYTNTRTKLGTAERLFVFSDGAYEIRLPNRAHFSLDEFETLLTEASSEPRGALGRAVAELNSLAGGAPFSDDVSLLELGVPHGP